MMEQNAGTSQHKHKRKAEDSVNDGPRKKKVNLSLISGQLLDYCGGNIALINFSSQLRIVELSLHVETTSLSWLRLRLNSEGCRYALHA